MMHYFAKITKESRNGFLVEFPGLAGCLTEGKTMEAALCNAKEALDGWLMARLDRNFKLPIRKRPGGPHFYPIEVDVQIAFAIRLRALRKKRGLTQDQVARKLGISQQAYAKLEDAFRSNPSLTTIRRLADVLKADMDIRLVA